MKEITFEQFRKINNEPMGLFAVNRYDSGLDHKFYLTMDRVEWQKKWSLNDVKYAAVNFKNAANHQEFLNQDLIHYLEDDEESRVLCGEMHYSYDYEEYKKDTQRNKNNISGQKSRSKSKIKDCGLMYRKLVNLENLVKEVTKFIGPLNEVVAN